MNKSHLIWGVGGLLLGVVLANKVKSLPLGSKIPQV